MLSNYLHEAIKKAKYEVMDDAGSIYAEIPDCQGVYAKASSFEECRSNLIEVLEEWFLIRLRHNLYIPSFYKLPFDESHNIQINFLS
jgi:predicted RNase H-like HicB family nuclease